MSFDGIPADLLFGTDMALIIAYGSKMKLDLFFKSSGFYKH